MRVGRPAVRISDSKSEDLSSILSRSAKES